MTPEQFIEALNEQKPHAEFRLMTVTGEPGGIRYLWFSLLNAGGLRLLMAQELSDGVIDDEWLVDQVLNVLEGIVI